MEAVGLKMPVGSTCVVELPNSRVEAEVVGFSGEKLFLMPENDVQGLMPGRAWCRRSPCGMPALGGKNRTLTRRAADRTRHLPVGNMLLGRVLDGAGRPLDQLGPLPEEETAPLQSRPINPLDRAPIKNHWMSACAPSTPCLPWAAANAWACSPAAASAKACCSA